MTSRTTIDKAGCIVIPAALRERVGLVPGPVGLVLDGNAIRIESDAPDNLIEKDGRLRRRPRRDGATRRRG